MVLPVPPSTTALALLWRTNWAERIPIVLSVFVPVAVEIAVYMRADEVTTCGGITASAAFCHLAPGKPMTVPIRFNVPDVLGRMNMFADWFHGGTLLVAAVAP